jgi:hypothetical protein
LVSFSAFIGGLAEIGSDIQNLPISPLRRQITINILYRQAIGSSMKKRIQKAKITEEESASERQ